MTYRLVRQPVNDICTWQYSISLNLPSQNRVTELHVQATHCQLCRTILLTRKRNSKSNTASAAGERTNQRYFRNMKNAASLQFCSETLDDDTVLQFALTVNKTAKRTSDHGQDIPEKKRTDPPGFAVQHKHNNRDQDRT